MTMLKNAFMIFVFILSTCYGCSSPTNNGGEQNQEQQSEPIPTNPQHS